MDKTLGSTIGSFFGRKVVALRLSIPGAVSNRLQAVCLVIFLVAGVPGMCHRAVRSPAVHEKWGWSSAAHRWYWPLKVMGVFSKKNTNALSSARMLQTCLNNAEVCFGS